MKKLVYGNGNIRTQQGFIEGEGKVLTITTTPEPRPIGSTAIKFASVEPQDAHDVILVFKTLESARVLQDQVNELCAIWAREDSEKVTDPLLAAGMHP